MKQAQLGDKVKITFTGTLENGKVFDQATVEDPREIVLGEGTGLPGFEQRLIGMEVGDKKQIAIPPEEAFGNRDDRLIVDVELEAFPDDFTPEVDMLLQLTQPDGSYIYATVMDIDEDKVTLDANNPLAGETIHVNVELMEIL